MPVSDWNYGFCSESFEISHGKIGDYPFSVEEPPVCLKTKMVKVPCEEKYGVCAVEPSERKAMGEPEEKVLQTYGCNNLRMTEMPYITDLAVMRN